MDGYTIFLGPFAGIMVTDVGVAYRHARSRLVID
jgi:cytosine/uracil/thiamine/allantoin permease